MVKKEGSSLKLGNSKSRKISTNLLCECICLCSEVASNATHHPVFLGLTPYSIMRNFRGSFSE